MIGNYAGNPQASKQSHHHGDVDEESDGSEYHSPRDGRSSGDRREDTRDESKKKSNKIEIWGNSSTMNLSPYPHKKILSSAYFKSLYEYKTYHEVLELIKNIKYIHPFTDAESSGSPSIAFSLLLKLHTLKLSYKQINGMLYQKDQPVIVKAMALLYVRFAIHPDEMWNYFKDFVNDETNQISIYTRKLTLGEFVRHLVKDQKFFGSNCILPLIPAKSQRYMDDEIGRLVDDYRQRNPNKRKSYDDKYSNRSYESSRKKTGYDDRYTNRPAQQQPKEEPKEQFEPAESRFSKPNFSKAAIPANYTKKYATTKRSDDDENAAFKRKDVNDVDTIILK